jgi:N6-adenosine-specific RNA methylase IME4
LASPGAQAVGTNSAPLKSVKLPYRTMPVDDIKALPVADMAATNAHLYVWTINRYVENTYEIARCWGFEPKTLLVWAKAPMGIGPGGAFSITTEYIMFATRGHAKAQRRWDTTWWSWPRGRHSAKPDAFLDIVEQVSPGPYAELFARAARFGWDYPVGNQALGGKDA